MESLSPIVIFTYKRLDTLKKTIEVLKQCYLANRSELIFFSDAPKGEKDFIQVNKVRNYIKEITGFRSIKINFAEANKGLASSIIEGVTNVINHYEKVIVLEDDLLVSKNFLVYMNQALDQYMDNKKVFSISGYTIPIKTLKDNKFDVYFIPRVSSWGWATWKDRWEDIDWEIRDYLSFRKNKKKVLEFNQGGSDLSRMLARQMKGKINSWAIRWCYHQFRTKTLTAYPLISKVTNIGFSDQATHSNVYNRYKTPLDNGTKTKFLFPYDAKVDLYLLKQFQFFFSVIMRIFSKLKTYLFKLRLLKNN